MEYYKKHPGLKSSEKEQVDETILDWESDINLTYCYSYLDLSDAVTYDTVLALPPIVQDSILMADISAKYYNDILYAVQEKYFQASFDDSLKKLMVVDLEKTLGGDSLQIKTLIGNTQQLLLPAYDWYWGGKQGVCISHQWQTDYDAAIKIAEHTRFHFYEAPPQGQHWSFVNIEDHIVMNPRQQDNNGNYIYLNPDDDIPNDNYEDYTIFYANENIADGLTEDVRCLEHYDELAFYKQSYINITQNWIDNTNGKKFQDCEYDGIEVAIPGDRYIKHRLLNTYIGTRFSTSLVTGNIAIY